MDGPDVDPGVMFGPYRLGERIGRGGMGEVHRAIDTGRDRVVAIKRLLPHLAADADFQARFRKEASVAARLHDPHVIPIHDFGEIDGLLFIDMRWVDGLNLDELLARDGPLDPGRAVDLVVQTANGVDAAHQAGLVHRDIKPSNVLVTTASAGDEFAYIADFGIARVVAADGSTLTGTGMAVGSLDYMAPERFSTGYGDRRVDVYSLGCLLYQLLTGVKPFRVEGLPAAVHAHLMLPPPRPSASRPELPRTLDDVVVRAMAKDPDARFPTAGSLASAARAALRPAGAGEADRVAASTVRVLPETVAGGVPRSTPGPQLSPVPPPTADLGLGRSAGAAPAARPVRRWLALAAVAVVVVVGLLVGVTQYVLPLSAPGQDGVLLLALDAPGPDPFGPDFTVGRAALPASAKASSRPQGVGARPSGETEGLYRDVRGGTACDRDGLARFLADRPALGLAWATALTADAGSITGLDSGNVAGYVAALTPVLLRADTRATAHGYVDGRAQPHQVTLQAGTAVLVDDRGVPRVRCADGGPLTTTAAPAGPAHTGTPWPGFEPAAVVTVGPGPTAVPEFGLVDLAGMPFRRPPGTTGGRDFAQTPENALLDGSYELEGEPTRCLNYNSCDEVKNRSISISISDCPRCVIDGDEWDDPLTATKDGAALSISGPSTFTKAHSFTCDGILTPTNSSLTISTVSAEVVDGIWRATSVRGEFDTVDVGNPGCNPARLTFAMAGTRR